MSVSNTDLALSLNRHAGMTTINKFGRNAGVPNGSWEPVTSSGAQWLPQAAGAKAVRIKAGGNAADDAAGAGARSVTVIGLDSNWDEATETIATAGASASSATSTTFVRIYRAFVATMGAYATAGGAANTGLITIEASDGSTDIIEIPAGDGQSQHCSFSVPRGYEAIITDADGRVPSTQSTDLRLVVRLGADGAAAPYYPARVVGFRDRVTGGVNKAYAFNAPIVGPADIWIEARGSSAGAIAAAEMDLILVAI